MVQTTSTSSAIVALLALTSILPQSVTALPTHRSSSAITRRAHILSHHDPLPLSKRTQLGDHSVYVDASTSQPGGTGGVRNSTINLTVVSKRDSSSSSSSTFSTFSRVVRSLFRRSPPTPSSILDTQAQVKLVALPQHTAAPYTKGHRTSRRQHQAAAALSRRSQSSNKVKRSSTIPSPRIGIVVPPRPKNLKRSTIAERKLQNGLLSKRQNYDSGSSQASIYAAAVAAIESTSSSSAPSPQTTAEPILALAMEGIPSSLPPPITLTMTLVPNSQGAYIDAAALPSPTSTLSAKLRQRRSTFVERSENKKREQQQDTSQLKRSINPKTGSFPSPSSPSASASQTQTQEAQAQAPKWTAIAHF